MVQVLDLLGVLRIAVKMAEFPADVWEALELAAMVVHIVGASLDVVFGYMWLRFLEAQDGDCCCAPQSQVSDSVRKPEIIGYPVMDLVKLSAVELQLKEVG